MDAQPKAGELDGMVGACGFEPQTSSVSGKRSNQLSYAPMSLLPACSPSLTGDLPDASGRSNQLSYAPKFLAPAGSPSSTRGLSHLSGRPDAAKLREGQTIPRRPQKRKNANTTTGSQQPFCMPAQDHWSNSAKESLGSQLRPGRITAAP